MSKEQNELVEALSETFGMPKTKAKKLVEWLKRNKDAKWYVNWRQSQRKHALDTADKQAVWVMSAYVAYRQIVTFKL